MPGGRGGRHARARPTCRPSGFHGRAPPRHASGLPFEGTAPVSPPGRRRIYSNAGYEALAAHLEREAGIDFGEYLKEAVLVPLGMLRTTLKGSPAHGAQGPLIDLALLAGELLSHTLVSPETWQLATSVAFA